MKWQKIIKKELNNKSQWKEYKLKYKNKQMRLIFSRIILNLNPLASISTLLQVEKESVKVSLKNGEMMFKKVLNDFSKKTKVEANWDVFSKFMFYVYQTSTYWNDVKKGVDNVFNEKNYIAKNALKRKYYNEWILSLKLDDNLNMIVRKTMKEVF